MKIALFTIAASIFISIFLLACSPKASDSMSDSAEMSDYNLIILLKNGYFDKLIKEELGNYKLKSVKPINKSVPQFLVEFESSQSDIESILKKLNDNEAVIKAELASDSTMEEITTGKSSKKSKVPAISDR